MSFIWPCDLQEVLPVCMIFKKFRLACVIIFKKFDVGCDSQQLVRGLCDNQLVVRGMCDNQLFVRVRVIINKLYVVRVV